MTPLLLLLLIVVLVLLWQVNLRSRDMAIRTARETCRNRGMQFLDGTASLHNIRPFFSRSEGAGIKRTYVFDYSEDGIARHTGCIVMHNTEVTTVLLEH